MYANPPVVLVVLEVRHPTADPLTATESREIKKRLGDLLPIQRSGKHTNVEFVGSTTPDVSVENFPRYMDRDSKFAVSLRREAVVVETSCYSGWKSFRELVMRALDVRMDVVPIVGVERLGLRYVNEIRVPDDAASIQWSEWMHPSLLGPASSQPPDLPLSQWQGVAIYGAQPGRMLVLRYGPRTGFAVDPSSDLQRIKTMDGGPFFLLDLDSFWTPGGSIPEFERDTVQARCDELHAPIRALFDGMVKDRLREEVFVHND